MRVRKSLWWTSFIFFGSDWPGLDLSWVLDFLLDFEATERLAHTTTKVIDQFLELMLDKDGVILLVFSQQRILSLLELWHLIIIQGRHHLECSFLDWWTVRQILLLTLLDFPSASPYHDNGNQTTLNHVDVQLSTPVQVNDTHQVYHDVPRIREDDVQVVSLFHQFPHDLGVREL